MIVIVANVVANFISMVISFDDVTCAFKVQLPFKTLGQVSGQSAVDVF